MRGIDNLKPTAGDGISVSGNKVSVDTTFTEASTRANINSGDTMSGRLTIDQQSGNSGLWLGNNIIQGNTGASRGLLLLYGLNQYYGQIYDGNGLTGNRDYLLPDASGTIALIPRHTKLFDNIYISTADQWVGLMNPTVNLNDYEYLGFSFCEADNSYDQSKIQVLIKVLDFKSTTQSYPLVVVDYPWNGGNEWKLRVAWSGQDGLDIYRGNQVYQYKRLVCIGIKF